MTSRLIVATLLFCLPLCSFAVPKGMTDKQIRHLLVEGSISTFPGECPCPFSKDSKGKVCGDNSQYFISPGDLYCYEDDITDDMINKFRKDNHVNDPAMPWLIY